MVWQERQETNTSNESQKDSKAAILSWSQKGKWHQCCGPRAVTHVVSLVVKLLHPSVLPEEDRWSEWSTRLL